MDRNDIIKYKAPEVQSEKKKRRIGVGGKILIVIGALIVVLVLVVVIMGTSLLNRIVRPDDPDAFANTTPDVNETPHIDDEVEPEGTPTPTRSPVPLPTDPAATPLPVLPVSEFYEQTYLTEEQLAKMDADNASADYVNILLVGVDRRKTTGRSAADALMIGTLDKKHGTLKITTVMRDILVDIPGSGYGKLNSSSAHGGMNLLMETVNQTFHMNITQYVLVDFFMFVDIIDALGGITMELSAEEISAANDCIAGLNKQLGIVDTWDGFIFAEAGPVHLSGKQALGYARIRKIDSDFARTDRQFKVINTVFSMFMRQDILSMYDILYQIVPMVETNLTNTEIIDLAISALSLKTAGIVHYRIPVNGLYENGKWEKRFVFLSDLPANAWALHELIFDSVKAGTAMPELTPNPSLPPSTPRPTGYYINPDTGEMEYYYLDDPPFTSLPTMPGNDGGGDDDLPEDTLGIDP